MTTASKSQRAYEVIRGRIVDGSYSPGHRLVLDRLARELRVSPVPVREAVRRLEAERYVEFERNVGARVSGIDPTEYRHAMQTLAIVEAAATALAGPLLTAADLAGAREINETMRRGLDAFDPAEFTALNARFHQALHRPCPNPHLADLVERGWARMALVRTSTFVHVPERAPASVAEHDRLLALLSNGAAAEDVERYARRHRLATLDAFLTHTGEDNR